MSAAKKMEPKFELSPESQFPRVCTKCKQSYDEAVWYCLDWIGDQDSEDDEWNYSLELRNCPCHGTMGLEWRSPK